MSCAAVNNRPSHTRTSFGGSTCNELPQPVNVAGTQSFCEPCDVFTRLDTRDTPHTVASKSPVRVPATGDARSNVAQNAAAASPHEAAGGAGDAVVVLGDVVVDVEV